MGELYQLLKALLLDSTAEEKARLSRVAFRLFLTLAVLWVVGAFSFAGFRGMARADDVDAKITTAVKSSAEPLADQLQSVIAKQNEQDDVLKQIRIDQLGQKIREFQKVVCSSKTDAELRARMELEIDIAQRQYRALAGDRYPLAACERGMQ